MRPSNISPEQSIQQQQQQQLQQNNGLFVSSTTPFPEPFESKQPIIDPLVANAIYQQHQININPTYNPLRDENVLNPYVANAFLNQQVYPSQNANNLYGVRQGVDGTVSTLPQNQLPTQPTRPNFPFFNWFNNNNNNDNNAQMDSNQQQQGPIISFISQIPNNIQNFAQNNPLTNFLNNFQPNQQQTQQNSNPFQNFISNAQNTIQQINPFQNIFSTPNKNPVSTQISNLLPTLPQSDYIPQGSINNQIDTSVFSNDRFQTPAQFSSNLYTSNNPYLTQQYQNTPQFGNLQSNLIASNIPQQLPGFPQNNVQQQLSVYSLNNPTNQLSGYSQNVYPQQQWPSANNVQQYNQQFQQAQQYPMYQRPLNPSTLVSNNVSKKKNRKKTKNGTKTSVEIPDSESNWFQDFLDKRKEISIETNTKKSSNKSDEDDDDVTDYFLK